VGSSTRRRIGNDTCRKFGRLGLTAGVYACELRFDVDWTHGAEHMWAAHKVSVPEAVEALADVDAQLFDPDPKSTSGAGARLLGYSPTAAAVLVLILVHRQDKSTAWWGATGWHANSTDQRTYREGTPS